MAFAAYVLALVATLMLAGHWSDHIGRRAALVLAVLMGLPAAWSSRPRRALPALCAGRALQGVAVALATGASSAALRELLPEPARVGLPVHPAGLGRWSGGGAGDRGMLSLLPGPTSTPYLIHSWSCAALLVPLYLLKARPAISRRRSAAAEGPALRAGRRSPATPAAPSGWPSAVGFLSFAVFGFCLSLAPGYFAQIVQPIHAR